MTLDNKQTQTPYLEIDLIKVSDAYSRFQSNFKDIETYYAMKCNPNVDVMKTILACGGSFEISSANEMRKALEVGANPATILFSNPVKTSQDIMEAYKAGVNYFAFDSKEEIDKLAASAPTSNVYVRIATPNRKSMVASEGKFGISIEAAADLMKYAKYKGLIPYGISFHVGSQMLDVKAWNRAIKHASKLIRVLSKDGIKLVFLDIGGGFPVKYADVKTDNIDKIALLTLAAIKKYIPGNFRVVAEPGRYLVAESGTMVSTVIGKATRFDKKWLHLDVGADNGLMEAVQTANTLIFPVHDSKQSAAIDKYNLTGPTCDSQDTILFGASVSSNIEIGDRVYFEYAGAYSTAFTENFNGFPNPTTHTINNQKGQI